MGLQPPNAMLQCIEAKFLAARFRNLDRDKTELLPRCIARCIARCITELRKQVIDAHAHVSLFGLI